MFKQLPEEVLAAWKEREGPVVLVTVDREQSPNAIYASIAHLMSDGRLAVADNYFDKTKANIDIGSKASLLFITKNRKAYQVKGTVDYRTSGPLHEEMLAWADPKHPRKGVAILNADTVFKGKEKLL
ncbi:MAG: pyridoxamine 5'-phosphate oxidase family protein [Chitinispirillaceae bacterium]|nr:pyridoxamine 5'-phosphate oxidase family protein [Chitinispirillaceae bacterium]